MGWFKKDKEKNPVSDAAVLDLIKGATAVRHVEGFMEASLTMAAGFGMRSNMNMPLVQAFHFGVLDQCCRDLSLSAEATSFAMTVSVRDFEFPATGYKVTLDDEGFRRNASSPEMARYAKMGGAAYHDFIANSDNTAAIRLGRALLTSMEPPSLSIDHHE